MDIKKILLIVGALVVGFFAVKIALWVISGVLSLAWWAVVAALTVGVSYALYRGFTRMLNSGKRLT